MDNHDGKVCNKYFTKSPISDPKKAALWAPQLDKPLVLGEVKMAFDVQQCLLEEGQPLDFMLLALVKHLLHALHVLGSAFVQFFQRLLILFFSLRQKTEAADSGSTDRKII